jgi:hypothetical protein
MPSGGMRPSGMRQRSSPHRCGEVTACSADAEQPFFPSPMDGRLMTILMGRACFECRRTVPDIGGEDRQGGKQKNPHSSDEWRSCEAGIPCTPHPRRSLSEGARGRSPDSRIILLANAFPTDYPSVARPVGFRPRSQWRAREGIAPSSRKLRLYRDNL